jgi:RNA polymerase sigma factor (sigma-70 family)
MMEDRPDSVLVERAVRGDGDSFTELCRRYYGAMVAIGHAIIGDRHLAEDAAQQALARAAVNLPKLRDASQFGRWVAAICRNEARDLARARRAEWMRVGARGEQTTCVEPDAPQPLGSGPASKRGQDARDADMDSERGRDARDTGMPAARGQDARDTGVPSARGQDARDTGADSERGQDARDTEVLEDRGRDGRDARVLEDRGQDVRDTGGLSGRGQSLAPTRSGDVRDAVREALGRLPAQAREVIFLRFYDGLSYEQISAVLGISEQAINGRLRRAKRKLAEHLRRSGFDEVVL